MEVVVDANVLVAGFLRPAATRELLLDERLSCWSPEHGLTEARRVLVSPRIRRRLGPLSDAHLDWYLGELTVHVRFAARDVYRSKLSEARDLAPHHEDAPYLALAMHLGVALWSNDAALKRQTVVPVHSTQQILELLVTR